ncbi:unnamed protein product [Penicillium manginii]
MPSILSKIATKFGLLKVHITVVRQNKNGTHVIQSSFPQNDLTVNVILSVPYQKDDQFQIEANEFLAELKL